MELDQRFEKATDAGFRARATAEYKKITSWCSSRVDFDSASILDFGCGQGVAAASFALRHPGSRVDAYDIEMPSEKYLEEALNVQIGQSVPKNLQIIKDSIWDKCKEKYDLVYLWSVIEHMDINGIVPALNRLAQVLKPNGVIFVHCEPLYFSPYGSLLYRYEKEPWFHLTRSLTDVRNIVLTRENKHRESREWNQFLSLNRLTRAAAIEAFNSANLKVLREGIHKTELIPPKLLAMCYQEDALRTVSLDYMLDLNSK